MDDNRDPEQAPVQEPVVPSTTFSTDEASTTEEEEPIKTPSELDEASTTEEEDPLEKQSASPVPDDDACTSVEQEQKLRLVGDTNEEEHMLRESINPFAVRPGHRLDFFNVNVTVKKRNKADQTILRNVCGSVLPKRVCCVMGASGSGKTTLLHVLAGKLRSDGNISVDSGEVTLDGKSIDTASFAIKQKIAFVAQHDTLLPTATPREAIRFSARLRLPRGMKDSEIEILVDRILSELQLSHRADEMTGGAHFKCLSGGEMRRVSLGVELVVRPSIVFLDEALSGLDSYNAPIVMEACKRVASAGAAVLMTIHQPSSKIFGLIDDMLLVKEGRVMYHGSKENMISYFEEHSYSVPPHYNPADWILQVSQTNSEKQLESDGFYWNFPNSEPKGPIDFDEAYKKSLEDEEERRQSFKGELSQRVSWQTELKVQLVRELRNLWRDSRAMAIRFTLVFIGSVLLAIGFSGVGTGSNEDISEFQSHIGVVFLLILVTVIALQVVLLDFIETRPIFVREYATGHFRMITYGIVKFVMEAWSGLLQLLASLFVTYWTIGLQARFVYWLSVLFTFAMGLTSLGVLLASATKDARNAKELIPMTVLPQLIFCGFFVRIDSLPSWLQWAQWVMPLTYSFRLLLHEEFAECLEFTDQERHVMDCFESLQQAFPSGGSGDFSWTYTDESVYLVPQTGLFVGGDEISQHLGLFSDSDPGTSFWEACDIDNTAQILVNDAKPGYCDISFGYMYQAQFNPLVMKPDSQDEWFQSIYGGRLRFQYSKDFETLTVLNRTDYYGDVLGAVQKDINQDNSIAYTCQVLNQHCPDVMERSGFENFAQCNEKMKTLPFTTLNEEGFSVADGNSTLCRATYAGLVESDPSLHCPHLSFGPMLDSNGDIKCWRSDDYDLDDFLEESDYDLFNRIAGTLGLDLTTKTRTDVEADDLLACREGPLFNLDTVDDVLPGTFLCAAYLEEQQATGDLTEYWICLLIFVAVFRGVSLVLLRRKTN